MKTILALFLTTSTVALAGPADWKHTQALEVAAPGLIKLSLPAATIDAAQPGLPELRILDPTGRELPYLLERPVAGQVVRHRVRRLDAQLEAATTRLLIETGVAEPIESLALESPAGAFIKAVDVDGSSDGRDWRPIVSGQPIFRQGNAAQLQIRFPADVWAFLRVTVDDRRAEAVAFTGALVQATAGKQAPAETAPVTITDRMENNGQTRLTLDLGASQQTLAALRLTVTDPLFTRSVSVAVRELAGDGVGERVLARGTIFRVDVPGFKPAEQIDLPVDVVVPSRELLVLVDNADNPPLEIVAVNATRRPVYAVFYARQAGRFQVMTGNPHAGAPRYDLAALRSQLSAAAVSSLTLAPLADNPDYHPAEPLPELENLGVALDVAAWHYRKPVPVRQAGVQEVALDLDVLANSDVSFRDLRLMRAGQQRPYVVERTSLTQKVVPELTVANDPKRPGVSRWQLKLPHPNLPVLRLTCTTPTPLFQRTVRLSEEPTDERGEHYQRALGETTWTRTAAVPRATLALVLTLAPVTDTLWLETDNGDNPAIVLENVAVAMPVTRLWFKAPVEPASFLYYGNHDAQPPRYDLALIAPRLLAEEKTAVTLGAQEALKKSGVSDLFRLSGTKSVLFWGALVAVVVVLLVVIMKLLPKPPAPPSV